MPESVKFRHYLFGSNGVWRISTRMIGRMALPQYAGTKQKTLDVHFWYEGGMIKTDIRPSATAFDAEVRWDRAYSVQGGFSSIGSRYHSPSQTRGLGTNYRRQGTHGGPSLETDAG